MRPSDIKMRCSQSLEQATNARDVHLIFLPTDPKWDPYRADPRFEDLLATLQMSATNEARS
jgi:hypothetical protein